jgi:hypothetical protein
MQVWNWQLQPEQIQCKVSTVTGRFSKNSIQREYARFNDTKSMNYQNNWIYYFEKQILHELLELLVKTGKNILII